MRVKEIGTGLWCWTGLHPDWTPDEGGPGGWEQEVGCVYFESPGAVVLIDPLVPPEAVDPFYEALDRDVERAQLPVTILLTVESHRRSSHELAERYDGTIGEVPPGVEVAVSAWNELVFWIPGHRTLVFGDLVLGRDGGLRLPRSWIGEEQYAGVVEGLRPLLELPVEHVLVGHGEPMLTAGHEALARALG